jgi:hypothetical protein
MAIESISDAVRQAVVLIEKNTQDKVNTVLSLNNDRHRLVKTVKGLNYYVLFKRQFFFKFGEKFNLKGAGESINESYLSYALNNNIAAIVIVYASGYTYCVSPQEWHSFSTANNTVRVQKEGEKTHSIPLSIMRRWR